MQAIYYRKNLKSTLTGILTAALVITAIFAGGWQTDEVSAADPPAPYTTSGARDFFADVYPSLEEGSVFETATYKRVIDILTPARTVKYPDTFGAEETDHQVGGGGNDNSGSAKDGSVVFLLGSASNDSTQATIATIDKVAKEYGVDKIYNFDPKLDGGLFGGELDITNIPDSVATAQRNAYRALWNTIKNRIPDIPADYTSDSTYLVVVTLSDNIATKTTKGLLIKDSTYTEADIAKLATDVADVFSVIPGAAQKNAQELTPTNFEFFKSVVNGNNYDQAAHSNPGTSTYNNYKGTLSFTGTPGASQPRPRAYGDVLKDADNADGFRIVAVTYPELVNVLEHQGNYEVYFSGLWCPYSRPSFKYINKAAQDNDLDVVYQFDFRLDSRSDNVHIRNSSNEYSYLYGKLLDTYLTNFNNGSWNGTTWTDAITYYPDHDKTEERLAVPRIGVPTLIEYDKDRKDGSGKSVPLYVGQIGFESWDYVQGGADVDEIDDADPYHWGEYAHRDSAEEIKVVYQNIAKNIHDRRATLYPYEEPYYGLEDWHLGNNEPVADGDCGSDEESGPADLTVKPFPARTASYDYDIKNYNIDLTYNPLEKGSERYTVGSISDANATINASTETTLSEIKFNLGNKYKIDSVTVNGKVATASQSGNRLTVKPSKAVTGNFAVSINYNSDGKAAQGLIASLNSTGATSDFSTSWYPTNPNDKAKYTVSITAPSNLVGVSNGKLVSTTVYGPQTTRNYVQNDETNPGSVVLSVGNYKQFNSSVALKNGKTIPVTAFVDKAIYNSSPENKAIVNDYVDKLDNIINWSENRLAAFPYVNFTAIFEKQARSADDEVDYSFSQEGLVVYNAIERETTIVHELIHQWYGVNLEQPDDSETWLSEGWAVFFANLYLEDNDSSTQTTSDWYREWYRTNYDTNFWSVPPGDLKNPGNTSYAYGRGAYALAALRASLADEDFFNIIQTWTSENAGKIVTTVGFLETAERVADVDLTSFAATWIYGGTRPSSFPNSVLPKKTIDPGDEPGDGDKPDDGDKTGDGDKSGDGDKPGDGDQTGGDKQQSGTDTIAQATIKTAVNNVTLNGTSAEPKLTVKVGDTELKEGTDYTITYKNNKKIGKATAIITGIGKYAGTQQTITYKILPKNVTVKSLKAGAKKFTLKWKKVTGASNYQVRYKLSTAKKWKTVSVTAKPTSKVIKKLKKGKKYQVQIRAYTNVKDGAKTVKYYSAAWSKVKTVKIK